MRGVLALLLLIATSDSEAWTYSTRADPMGRGPIRTASIYSNKPVNLEFPYGPQRARLQLRVHPEYGQDVILSVGRGQFHCRFLERCYVLIRFDNNQAESWEVVGPSDHSTDTLFIQGYDHFLRQLHGAKRVLIEAEFFQQGKHILVFRVAGLKWDKPADPKPLAQPDEERELPSESTAKPPAETASVAVESGPTFTSALEAARARCSLLSDADYSRTMCETKLFYCQHHSNERLPDFEECMARY